MPRLWPLVLLFLAGCVAPDAAPAVTLQSLDGGGPAALFAYDCPPHGSPRADGLCVASVSDPTASEQEPFVAIHPHDPDVLALATNRGDVLQATSLLSGEVSTPPVELALRVTEDGGETWRRVPLPAVAHPKLGGLLARANLDPTMAFDTRGVLHVAAVVLAAGPGGEDLDVYYARTADLGRTWERVAIVSTDGSNDRPWIAAMPDGALYVTTHGGGAGGIYWSEDGGDTWRATDRAATLPGCTPTSPVVDADGVPTLACVTSSSLLGGQARVFSFDPTSGTTRELAAVSASGSEPFLARATDGSLLLQVEEIRTARGTRVEDSTVRLARSGDGGATWGAFLDLRDALTVEDAWASMQGYWIAADPWGHVHVIVQGCRNAPSLLPSTTSACPAAAGTQEFAHAVLDPATLAVLQERALTSPSPIDHALGPLGGGAGVGDHFGGIAFGGDRGVLAWTRYAPPASYASARTGPGISVDYTYIRPG